ncbi:MAG TPA: DUF488 domain-containing protein [Spirochaetales bacterium]|nr:DUF488 domain-containing protein [Spirochaetales bacterium]
MGAPLIIQRSKTTTRLITVGYEGRSIEEYCSLLLTHGIRAVVDVRKNPISRKKGFSKSALADALLNSGIAYFHLPNLGIDSSLRQELKTDADYKRLFSVYTKEILPLPLAQESLELLQDIQFRFSMIALTCFERDPKHCHRHCIADYIHGTEKIPVTHI